MIGKAIYSQLTGTAAVLALVSTRIDPQFNPKKARPAVVYTQDSIERDRIYANNLTPIAKVDTTITALADTYATCVQLAGEIVTALDRQSGTWGTVVVLSATVENEDEQVAMLDNGTDQPIYAKSMNVMFWIRT